MVGFEIREQEIEEIVEGEGQSGDANKRREELKPPSPRLNANT